VEGGEFFTLVEKEGTFVGNMTRFISPRPQRNLQSGTWVRGSSFGFIFEIRGLRVLRG
jgi:hypothetical protein